MSERGPAQDDPASFAPALAEVDHALGRLTGSTDGEFLAIGNILGRGVTVFDGLAGQFSSLAEQFHSQDAGSAAAALEQAMAGIQRMAAHDAGTAVPLLRGLDAGAAELERRLAGLGKIIGEIGGLAINGKIQAAQVRAAGVDFSVFTTEIGRLGALADVSTRQAARRMAEVRAAVASALAAASAFEANEGRELAAVRGRIDRSLGVITSRRNAAAQAAAGVAARSQQISQRVARTVGELQINDNVCQRIEHVREAARDLAAHDLVAGASAGRGFVGGACRLLSAQLKGGGSEYCTEVGSLIRNLSALGDDAAAVLAEAEATFSGSSGGLFVTEIEQDMRRAAELLTAYGVRRDQTREVVAAVSDTFRAMAEDLAAIRSIDADMRVMGLNATLKCGRLGNDGRALGVVAQELRGCSKRTEDCTHGIATVLEKALQDAAALAAASAAGDGGDDAATVETMTLSLAALSHLAASMSDALEQLRRQCGGTAAELTRVAGGIDVHHRLDRVLAEQVTRLAAIAQTLEAGGEPDDADHQAIADLMYPRYTMEQERAIHQAFARGHAVVVAEKPPEAEVAVDDLFF
ncbi:MAG: hypothetical protein ACM31D_00515 [Bacteroidota bacterium]